MTTNTSYNITYQLEILGNNKIIIPGCEPSSSITSKTLNAYLALHCCGSATIDLSVALAVIPGSYIKFGVNYNKRGIRQRWFVLPPITPECPCKSYDDYYKILKDSAVVDYPIEDKYDSCNTLDMGYCPHPDFKLEKAPEQNPYQPEGSFPIGGGVLPPIPPWMQHCNK